jgi:hypothetical protein
MVCGGAAQFAPPDAAAACQQCFIAQACQPAATFLGDAAYSAAVYCNVSSPTPDTQAACTSGLDAGPDGAWAGFANAIKAECLESCGFDSYWSCVGHVEWPPTVQNSMTLQFSLFDVVYADPSHPVTGVTAKLCPIADPTCSDAGAAAQSDPQGNVTLASDGGVGNYYVGYLDLSGGGIVPELVFWDFPISQNVAVLQAVGTATAFELNTGAQVLDDAGWDAATGVLVISGVDCYLLGGAGLTYSINVPASPPTPFYTDQTGVRFAAGLTTTNWSGYGLFLNVQPGPVTVTASLPPPVGAIGQFDVFVRPGTITWVLALPSRQ